MVASACSDCASVTRGFSRAIRRRKFTSPSTRRASASTIGTASSASRMGNTNDSGSTPTMV